MPLLLLAVPLWKELSTLGEEFFRQEIWEFFPQTQFHHEVFWNPSLLYWGIHEFGPLGGIGHGPIELKTINQSHQMPFISKVWFDRDDWTLALSWELQKWWWIDWKIEHSLEPLTGFMLYRTLWKVEHFYCYSLLSFEYNGLASEFKWLLKWPTLYYCHLFHDKSTVTYKSS